MAEWDRTVDWLVMGSGAAGMASAIRAHDLGLDVLVVEKSDLFGGNTAMSGGVCWVANNPGMAREGIADSDEDGFAYLRHITKGEVPDDRLWLYIRESKRVLAYLQDKTHVRYVPLPKYTDYYPEAPGGRPGGRSMDPVPFDGAKLKGQLMQLRRPHPQSQIIGKFGITAREAHAAIGVGLRTMMFMAWQLFLYLLRYRKRKRWGRDTKLCAGNSLMGRLLLSARDRKIDAWLHASVEQLVFEDGRVAGAVIDKDGTKIRIQSSRGVLIAAGGFSRNLEMRERYQRHPVRTEWTAGTPSNTGDGIVLGEEAGGTLDLMDEAWWTPVSLVPGSPYSWVLVVEKSLPHGLFVNQDGKRFTNEAAPYIDVVNGMYDDVAKTQTPDPRWYHIFDATYRRSSVAGPVGPGKVMPDKQLPRRYRDGNYLYRTDTLEELAKRIDVPADALRGTINRFNEHARKGADPDFNRGWSAQDRYYGDPKVKPNCALGPIETGPFYAVQIYPGDLGTKGGLRTDDAARVLRQDGKPVAGLYAAGKLHRLGDGAYVPGRWRYDRARNDLRVPRGGSGRGTNGRSREAGSSRMSGTDWRSFGRFHAKLYQLLGGRLVGSVGGGRKILLLTTTGRKSGLARTAPLVYMPHALGSIVYASNGGKEAPPAWWLNLEADPNATIQIGADTHAVTGRAATTEEHAELWPQAEAYNSHWRDYQKQVKRKIPLVILAPR